MPVSDSDRFTLDEIRAAVGNSGTTRLRLLSVEGWFKSSELAADLGLTAPSVRDNANRLADSAPGLLERRESGSEDGAWEFRVTARGRSLRDQLGRLMG